VVDLTVSFSKSLISLPRATKTSNFKGQYVKTMKAMELSFKEVVDLKVSLPKSLSVLVGKK